MVSCVSLYAPIAIEGSNPRPLGLLKTEVLQDLCVGFCSYFRSRRPCVDLSFRSSTLESSLARRLYSPYRFVYRWVNDLLSLVAVGTRGSVWGASPSPFKPREEGRKQTLGEDRDKLRLFKKSRKVRIA